MMLRIHKPSFWFAGNYSEAVSELILLPRLADIPLQFIVPQKLIDICRISNGIGLDIATK